MRDVTEKETIAMSLIFIRVLAGFLSGMFFGILLARYYYKKEAAKPVDASAAQ